MLELRSEQSTDEAFIFQLFAAERAAEIAPLSLSQQQKQVFLQQQFKFQCAHYHAYYPNADFSIIQLAEIPIGRLYVERAADAIRIIDITLAENYRNQGIGYGLLHAILQEAAATQRTVKLQVTLSNSAQRLYRCLGFAVIQDDGIYLEMESPQA